MTSDNGNLPDISAPDKLIKQCNFLKLSLSQNHKKDFKVTPISPSSSLFYPVDKAEKFGQTSQLELKAKRILCDRETTFLKVRNVSELMSPSPISVPILESNKGKSTIQKGCEIYEENEVIVISSDDENDKNSTKNEECFTTKRKINRRKTSRTQKKSFTGKQKNYNYTDSMTKTPVKISKDVQNIKNEIRNIAVQRHLTKSTNLKRFPAKYLPSSQRKIDSYFKTIPNENESIKYYETFDKSKPKTNNITEECKTSYLQDVSKMEQMKQVNSGISQSPPGFENMMLVDSTFKDDDDNFFKDLSERLTHNMNNSDKNDNSLISQLYEEKKNYANSGYQGRIKRKTVDILSCSAESIKNCQTLEKVNKVQNQLENFEKSLSHYLSPSRENSMAAIKNSQDAESALPFEQTETIYYAPSFSQIRKSKRLSIKKSTKKSVFVTMGSSATSLKASNDQYKEEEESSKKNIATSSTRNKRANSTTDKKNKEKTEKFKKEAEKEIIINSRNCKVNKKLNFCATQILEVELPLSYPENGSQKSASNSFTKNESEISENLVTTKPTSKITRTRKTRTGQKLTSITCPNYKIITGTTFSVDAFRFGYIDGITHYFLTHFHADHYIGLKKSFQMPIYLSEITAKLVASMIGTDSEFLNVLRINETILLKDIEITAIDANHCPGAIMLHFRFPDGKCILHTGDFRASAQMESEPIFWNNSIHTIYLDTTYLSCKYAFKPQSESIDEAIEIVKQFHEKHNRERILIICGTYVVGKEKVWMAIAEKCNLTVWMDGNRKKTVKTIGNPEMLKYLNDNPCEAGIHVLTMRKLSYDYLWQYLKQFSEYFDVILALRPSGWEKNSKPQYRGKVNIVGIEYSEHSSYDELRRFVRFLQPIEIISTVPYGNDYSKTTKIPRSWFNNDLKNWQIPYQSSITNYLKFNSESLSKSKKRQDDLNVNKNSIIASRHHNYMELEEIDGLVLDATHSNITLRTPTKSLSRTPDKFHNIGDSPHKSITTITTDWMS